MKILHTSDWHIGATHHTASRAEEHRRFFAWLCAAIERLSVDVLVVAGDIFDRQQPSNESLSLYYCALLDLSRTRLRQVIIVGGNHDSASQLEAPKEVLAALRINVVGGWNSAAPDTHIVPLRKTEGGDVEAVVIAVPYVHEYTLGLRMTDLDAVALLDELETRIAELYSGLCDRAEAEYPGKLLIGTGHLTALGSDKLDAPRDVHMVGSIGELGSSIFDPRLRYIALGHIHRHMPVKGTRAVYSGTPIPIGPREMSVGRIVVCLTVGDLKVRYEREPVPLSRRLVALQGSVAEVYEQVTALQWDEPLPPYVSVELLVAGHVAGADADLHDFFAETFAAYDEPPQLLKVDLCNTNAVQPAAVSAEEVATMTVSDVFDLLCDQRGIEPSESLRIALSIACDAAGVAR